MRPQVKATNGISSFGKQCVYIRVRGFESDSVFALESFFQYDRQLVYVLAWLFPDHIHRVSRRPKHQKC
jgi:hypothetical protein